MLAMHHCSCRTVQRDSARAAWKCYTQSMTLIGMLSVGCSARPSRGSNSGGEPPPSGRTNGKSLRHFSMKVQSATLVLKPSELQHPSSLHSICIQVRQWFCATNRLWADQGSNKSDIHAPLQSGICRAAGSSAATGFAKGCCCARACSLASA